MPSGTPSRVVDASALAKALTDRGREGALLRTTLTEVRIIAPDYTTVEVASAIRGLLLRRVLSIELATEALHGLSAVPIDQFDTRSLLVRIWELRDNLTAYDAGYVALAEALDCPLITADRRLAHAPGIRCAIETV